VIYVIMYDTRRGSGYRLYAGCFIKKAPFLFL